MKKILSLTLLSALLLLCGCAKAPVPSAEPSAPPEGTSFAATTVFEDDTLRFEVVSAAMTETGVSYAVLFQNKTDEALNAAVTNVTVNGVNQASKVGLSVTVDKNASLPTTLSIPLSSGETAREVGLHLTVGSGERWWKTELVSRDLVFYPVPRPTQTATATAAH